MSLGLALSGGGVKGAAHIGVLKALEEENIKIDYIGGTSSGSIVSTLYAAGYKPDEIYDIFKKYCKKIKYVDIKNIFKLFFGLITTGTIKIDGLNSGKSINKLINKVCNEKNICNISDIDMPLAIPSVDMNTGEVVCFTSSKIRAFSDNTIFVNNFNVGNAVQASCSFPTVFSPCDYKNAKLIDGGIRENVPWREVKLLGADKVISVVFENEVDESCCKNLIDVAFRSFELMCKELSKYEQDGIDYLIKIKSEKVSLLDMSKIDEFYQLGYNEAKKFVNKNKFIVN
ncbi:MAG: patatin-like phospholipase family protein [Clostridia bacterium]|nr:patatin-like phospholipase family protein [Clostridia bacterium]